MKNIFNWFGITYKDGSLSVICIPFYAMIVRSTLAPSIESTIALLVVGMIYVYDRYFHDKTSAQTIPASAEALDLSGLRADVDKLKLALSIKEFKR
jgi:hypothetical protein